MMRRSGYTREPRDQALSRLVKRLDMLVVALMIWTIYYPRPYTLLVTVWVCLPWAALIIVQRSNGIITLDEGPNSTHASVVHLFITPGLGLALLALDIQTVSWTETGLVAFLIGLSLWGAALWSDRSERGITLSSLVLMSCAIVYGYGAGLQANVLLDRSVPIVYRATLIAKHTSGHKYKDYKFLLEPVGPWKEIPDVSVSRGLYDAKEPGDSVCLDVKQGALHVSWYTVHACSD